MRVSGIRLRSGSVLLLQEARERLFSPVDGASLALFRVAFGVIMLWEARQMHANGWIEKHYEYGRFHFSYWPLDFVAPWPGPGMEVHLALLGLSAALIALGLFYRFAAVSFFILFSYLFLIEQTRYLNHFYLVCLISFLMIFLPLDRGFSQRGLFGGGGGPSSPAPHGRGASGREAGPLGLPWSFQVPAWALWLLRFQVAVPMFFGGVAKLNHDWLLGEPLRSWMASRTGFPLLGRHFTDEPMVWAFVYGALLLDLCFVFLMLHRRTRPVVFLFVLFFHFVNAGLFIIGIFPWFMIIASLLFFPPDLPRRIWRDVTGWHPYRTPAVLVGLVLGAVLSAVVLGKWVPVPMLAGGLGVWVALRFLPEVFRPEGFGSEAIGRRPEPDGAKGPGLTGTRKVALALVGAWMLVQVLLPLRHFAVPGNVSWTEEGGSFSWRMMLRSKLTGGYFVVVDPASGAEWVLEPDRLLTGRQASWMLDRPHLMVQFAHALEDGHLGLEGSDLEVYAHVAASLNGRPLRPLIDPDVDLTQVPRAWFGRAGWILPLED